MDFVKHNTCCRYIKNIIMHHVLIFRLFGGLVGDIRRKAPFYLSDFKDALHIQCLASFVFLYFACLTPIITFGGLLGQATDNNMVIIKIFFSHYTSKNYVPETLLTSPIKYFDCHFMNYTETYPHTHNSCKIKLVVKTAICIQCVKLKFEKLHYFRHFKHHFCDEFQIKSVSVL